MFQIDCGSRIFLGILYIDCVYIYSIALYIVYMYAIFFFFIYIYRERERDQLILATPYPAVQACRVGYFSDFMTFVEN